MVKDTLLRKAWLAPASSQVCPLLATQSWWPGVGGTHDFEMGVGGPGHWGLYGRSWRFGSCLPFLLIQLLVCIVQEGGEVCGGCRNIMFLPKSVDHVTVLHTAMWHEGLELSCRLQAVDSPLCRTAHSYRDRKARRRAGIDQLEDKGVALAPALHSWRGGGRHTPLLPREAGCQGYWLRVQH